MNTYKVLVTFKNGRELLIDLDAEENLQKNFEKEWVSYKKEGALSLGEYIISIDEILWIRIEGETIEKRSGEEL